jgi:hypothetical protein
MSVEPDRTYRTYRTYCPAGSLPQGTFHPDNPSDAELARRKKLAAEGSGI